MRAQIIVSVATATFLSLSAIAQVPLSPTNSSQVTAPSPQRQQPQGGGRQPLSPPIGEVPQTRPQVQILNGVLMGYLYWDGSAISAGTNSLCPFQVRVSQGTPPAGGAVGFEQFSEIGTYSNNFSKVGNIGKFVVCQYAVDHLPENKDLEVQIGPQKGALQTAVSFTVPPTANEPNTPVKIINGKCNQLPPAVPSLSTLNSPWWSCGDHAYNVNFLMQPYQAIPGLTQPPPTITVVQTPLLPSSGGANGSSSSTVQQRTLLSPAGPTTGMMAAGKSPAQSSLSAAPRAKAISRTGPITALKLSAPQQSREITNPNSGIQNSQIIAVLQQQTRAAQAEIAAMKLSLRPVDTQANSGPMQTMSANVSGGPAAGQATMQANLLAGNSGPGTRNSIGAAMPAPFQNLAITCTHDPTMRVLTVSGGQSSAVFTQDSQYNFYTISGCSFGDPGPNAKAYIYSQGTFREDFQIEQWSDNWIKLSIDPNLTGVDDQDNVTLVIQRADGRQASKGGFRFYAARDTVLLHSIPQQYFSLDRFRPDNAVTNNWTSTYTSASSAAIAPNLPGMSAEVQWLLTPVSNDQLLGGSDIYDFSKLHSTFGLQNAQMEWEDVSCDPSQQVFASSKDNWGIDWYQNTGVKVTWQGQTCNPKPGSCGGAFQGDCFLGQPETNYGIDVWVTGPRGLDPWTGKPVA
ncbi:hypothetical protein [Occallatibacter savannae]|uniref:hypothetical protein n=1 Tax=Occallatibacter savannae TaxID=1002691 RepID=UPI000D69D5F3|nr:hypothetical protein [Occallatibacter savannae]